MTTMKKKSSFIFFSVHLLWIWTALIYLPGSAWGYDNYGTSSKAVGMGNAFTAIADDPGAIFYNPAGLIWIKKSQLSVLYNRESRHINITGENTYVSFAGLVLPLKEKFSLGIAGTQRGSWEHKTNLITNNTAALALSGKIIPDLTFGTSVKFLFNTNAGKEKNFDLDLGLLYRVKPEFSIGVSGNGLLLPDMGISSNDLGFSLIPTRQFRVGMAYDIWQTNSKTTLAFDTSIRNRKNSSNNGNINSLGIEHTFLSDKSTSFAVRGGYSLGKDFGLDYNSYAFGFSVKINSSSRFYQIDYSYQDYPYPGTTELTGDHRISLTVSLGIKKPGAELAQKKIAPSDLFHKTPEELKNFARTTETKPVQNSTVEQPVKAPESIEDEVSATNLESGFDSQKLVSNYFYDYDIREALKDISAATGIPIITDESVKGLVTVELVNLPLEECLRRILTPFGYTFRRMDSYYLVGTAHPDNPSFPLLSTTELITPNYIKAKDCIKLLSKFYQPFISVDEETNTLAVTASPELIQRLRQDLAKIDIAPQQVMIEVLVTEFSQDALTSLGVGGSISGIKPGHSFSVIGPLSELLDSTLGLFYGRTGAKSGDWALNSGVSFQALVRDGKVKIRANPKVVTVEGQPAYIFVGKDQYYTLLTGSISFPYERLEVIKVGVSLNITPYISDNQEITIDVQPEVSDVIQSASATGLPVVSRRQVKTKVRVKEGETLVIGGLLQKNERETRRKIPLLGSIPILGYLFSHTTKVVEESEVVVFITPHIVK